jgi:hypothetical protein
MFARDRVNSEGHSGKFSSDPTGEVGATLQSYNKQNDRQPCSCKCDSPFSLIHSALALIVESTNGNYFPSFFSHFLSSRQDNALTSCQFLFTSATFVVADQASYFGGRTEPQEELSASSLGITFIP